MNLNSHIHHIYPKVRQKLNAMSRITPNTDFTKRCLLLNAFFYSQFTYSQLVWMCHNRTNNYKINSLGERCPRLIYSDKKSYYEDFLENEGSVSMHHRNLRTLAVEMLKVFKGIHGIQLFSCKTTKSIQYEELIIFCYASSQNGQPWIRKFFIHRFKIVG